MPTSTPTLEKVPAVATPIPDKTALRSTTATLLRLSRAKAGLSQAELASRSGTSQPAIARYENGTIRPRSDTLERILAACDVAPDDLTSLTRPLLGPVGEITYAFRYEIAALLLNARCTNVLVIGAVANALDVKTTPLEIVVTSDRAHPQDLSQLSRSLTVLIGHTAVVREFDPTQADLVRGARTL
jgi:transcriptional regulator with XRE-family HTH domain